jgi:hypothetical protein
MSKAVSLSDEKVISKIYLIREKKIMLDRDLAELYGVTTSRLNEQVKRNKKRFPADFMFQLSKEEFQNLISQNATSRWGGIRKLPYAFTEEGVAMLSGVLTSDTAIRVNIQIMRIFTRMREVLLTHKDILLKLENIEKQLLQQDGRLHKHDEEMQMIFEALKQLLNPPNPPRRKIGFKIGKEK